MFAAVLQFERVRASQQIDCSWYKCRFEVISFRHAVNLCLNDGELPDNQSRLQQSVVHRFD